MQNRTAQKKAAAAVVAVAAAAAAAAAAGRWMLTGQRWRWNEHGRSHRHYQTGFWISYFERKNVKNEPTPTPKLLESRKIMLKNSVGFFVFVFFFFGEFYWNSCWSSASSYGRPWRLLLHLLPAEEGVLQGGIHSWPTWRLRPFRSIWTGEIQIRTMSQQPADSAPLSPSQLKLYRIEL